MHTFSLISICMKYLYLLSVPNISIYIYIYIYIYLYIYLDIYICKSISIFIIQCPPKIMYICIYIYIHMTCLSGYFEEISTQQKPSIGALASHPEKKAASQASGLRLLKAIDIGAWENPRRWWENNEENLPMIRKREDPRGDPQNWLDFCGKKIPGLHCMGEVVGFWEWKQMNLQISCSKKTPFWSRQTRDLPKSSPVFLVTHRKKNLWEVGESSPVQQRSGKLRYWC